MHKTNYRGNIQSFCSVGCNESVSIDMYPVKHVKFVGRGKLGVDVKCRFYTRGGLLG